MLVRVPQALSAEPLHALRRQLENADSPWVDGRVTAGTQGARVKRNQQLAEHTPLARELGDIVLAALERNPLFISSVLPAKVYPPMFNRYHDGMRFDEHIDNAVRLLPGGAKIRTDVSITLFLNPPEDYDGGELVVADSYGTHAVKLPAGDAVVYPASSLHRVTPVTRGSRLACFFWVQSLVRDDGKRSLLFDLDRAIQSLSRDLPDHAALVQLTGTYHNLLRRWSDV